MFASLAHMLHDGFMDMTYVLLPSWQADFALDYAALALLRGLNVGVLAALQLPSSRLTRWWNARTILVFGTLLSSMGYALAGFSGGLCALCVSLGLAGAGGSTQHPLASSAISRAYGDKARGPLGTYNFAGDLGKALLPPLISVLLTAMRWRSALWIAAGLGFVVALSLQWLMPPIPTVPSVPAPISLPNHMVAREGGFWLLFVIGALDTATRIGFLLFLPFLLKEKGAGPPLIGLALSFVFIGGGFGKAACGWLGERFGLLATVVTTEVGTAATIFGLLHLQLRPSLALLPLLGIMLNGTSSVLYGTVPELVERSRLERAFAIFYTGVLGASALAPILYGRFGDIAGISWGTIAAALTALAVVPLMLILTPKLKKQLQVPE